MTPHYFKKIGAFLSDPDLECKGIRGTATPLRLVKGSLMTWFQPRNLCIGLGGQLLVFIPALLLMRSPTGTPADCWAAQTRGKDTPACAIDAVTFGASNGSRNLDHIWLSPSGEMLAVTSPGGTVRRAAFSADGSLLATAMDPLE
jgi:hypothetical protein